MHRGSGMGEVRTVWERDLVFGNTLDRFCFGLSPPLQF
jgi:hypothetical protein